VGEQVREGGRGESDCVQKKYQMCSRKIRRTSARSTTSVCVCVRVCVRACVGTQTYVSVKQMPNCRKPPLPSPPSPLPPPLSPFCTCIRLCQSLRLAPPFPPLTLNKPPNIQKGTASRFIPKKTKNKDRPSFEQKEEAGGRRVCVSEREREHY